MATDGGASVIGRRRYRIGFIALSLLASGCAPMVHIRTERIATEGIEANDPFHFELVVYTDSIGFTLTNQDTEPIEILWQKTSLVGVDGTTFDVMHDGGRGVWAARDFPGEDISRIPPKATLREQIIPKRSVGFEAGPMRSGWVVASYLPVECGPVRCTGYKDLPGKTVRLNMTVRTRGNERVFDWTFRIESAFVSTRWGETQGRS